MESKKKKNDTNELIYETNKLTDLDNKFMVTKGEGGEIEEHTSELQSR